MKNLIVRFVKDDSGQDLIEYSLLGAFIALAAFPVVQTIGTDVGSIYTKIKAMTGAANAAAS